MRRLISNIIVVQLNGRKLLFPGIYGKLTVILEVKEKNHGQTNIIHCDSLL